MNPVIKHTDTIALIGRILIAVLFILSGLSKAAAPAATQAYIASVGLPEPVLAYFGSMAVELIGSVLLIVGLRVRVVAVGMAFFTLLTAVFFHRDFADENQMINFLKNIAIIGGLLQVAAFGAGRFALDRVFSRTEVSAGTGRLASQT
jgi:putative oxidoreductase